MSKTLGFVLVAVGIVLFVLTFIPLMTGSGRPGFLWAFIGALAAIAGIVLIQTAGGGSD